MAKETWASVGGWGALEETGSRLARLVAHGVKVTPDCHSNATAPSENMKFAKVHHAGSCERSMGGAGQGGACSPVLDPLFSRRFRKHPGLIDPDYPDSVFLEPDLEKAMREEGVTILFVTKLLQQLRAPRDLEASKSTDFVKNKFTGNQMMAFKGAFGLFKGSTYISETIPHENVEKIILFPDIKDGEDQIFFVPKNLVQKYDSQ
ncbi:hypothetical protein BDP27DRAFT_1418226 [Rhodocollybia butyracea]|uniref:Uncharacterized protein n=1 Tax=Rhodocollybia butyracea TaxID=206335 RepID=A0A9P5PYN4_9AGAR|nr:hypothetical protein BDP27DRAFT_1418226 [Rhodocollybia butyracea]